MRNKLLIYGIVFAGLICIQASCKNTVVGGTDDCPETNVDLLTEKLTYPLEKQFAFFTCKVNVNIQDSKSSNSFSTSLKMRTDSAFSGTLKKAGILGGAYLVDRDTFAFKNRLKKCFKRESFQTLTDMFGTEVSYDFVQQLILGQAIGVEQFEQLYPLKDDYFYVVGSHDRKTFERMKNYNLKDEERDDIFIKYFMRCSTFELSRIEITVPGNAAFIMIDFEKRQKVGELSFPQETFVKVVSPLDSVFIDLDYGDIELNDPAVIRINIPDSYSECE